MVTSQYAPATQAGNGVTVAFNFAFKILATTDLVVSKRNAAGVSSGTLILGTDYTVTFDPIAETGTVTYTVAPVSGGFSNIARNSNNQQQTSLPRDGVMPAKTVETMIDKLTLLMQEIAYGQVTSMFERSGTDAARLALTPIFSLNWYSTDTGQEWRWSNAAQRWFLIG